MQSNDQFLILWRNLNVIFSSFPILFCSPKCDHRCLNRRPSIILSGKSVRKFLFFFSSCASMGKLEGSTQCSGNASKFTKSPRKLMKANRLFCTRKKAVFVLFIHVFDYLFHIFCGCLNFCIEGSKKVQFWGFFFSGRDQIRLLNLDSVGRFCRNFEMSV